MKYRIIKRGDGKYQVQRKKGFLYGWYTYHTSAIDYPDYKSDDDFPSKLDFMNSRFSSYGAALELLDKLVELNKHERLREKFQVIKEVSV